MMHMDAENRKNSTLIASPMDSQGDVLGFKSLAKVGWQIV